MNLIDTLKNELDTETFNSLSQKLNISPEQAKSGIFSVVPIILAGILKKVSGSGSLGVLTSIFTGNRQSIDVPPENELENTSSLLSHGSTQVGDLFDRKTEEVCNELAKETNLSTEKSKDLLMMSTPIVMGHIDKLIADKSLSISDFTGKLFEERASIENNLPLGLKANFGLSGLHLPHLNQTASDNIPPIEKVSPQNTIVPEPPSNSGSVLKWIIVIAILALLAWWFLG